MGKPSTDRWLLSYLPACCRVANPEDYKFFIFMNSSVRGPFIPPYARVRCRAAAAAAVDRSYQCLLLLSYWRTQVGEVQLC